MPQLFLSSVMVDTVTLNFQPPHSTTQAIYEIHLCPTLYQFILWSFECCSQHTATVVGKSYNEKSTQPSTRPACPGVKGMERGAVANIKQGNE